MITPLPKNESARLHALKQYEILDSEPEQSFDDLVTLAATICETPIALISLVDSLRQWSKAKIGVSSCEMPREIAFCAHAILQPAIFEVPDTLADPRFAANPFVTSDPFVRFYAGLPLINREGYALGTLCVIDRIPRQLTNDQRQSLTILGRQVVTLLEFRLQHSLLERSAADRDEQALRLTAIVNHAADGIITIDEQGTMESYNRAAEHLFGYTAAEAIGQNLKLLIPELSHAEPNGDLANYGCTGNDKISRETVGRRKDGLVFPLQFRVSEIHVGSRRLFTGIVRDLSERKQTEEQFRRVVESAPNGMLMVGQDGTISLVNAQIEQQFGYAREELLGQPVEILLPEQFRSKHSGQRMAFSDNPSHRPMGAGRDLCGRRKDGTQFPIEIGLNPIKTPEGMHVLASIVDITARKKQTDAVLLETLAFQRAILSHAGHAVIATTTSGVIQHFNPAAERLLGYTAEETIGKLTLVRFHDPEEVAARAKEFGKELGLELEPGFEVFVIKARRNLPNQNEWTYIRKDGMRIPILLSVTALRDSHGSITGFLGMALDLTDRKTAEAVVREAEERLELAAEVAGVAVWEWDIRSNRIKWDGLMFTLYGLPPSPDGHATYEDWRKAVLPEDLAAQEAHLQRTIRECGRSQRTFRIIRASDHAVRVIQASEAVIVGPDGQALRVVGINIDITERHEAKLKLQQAAQTLSSQNIRLADAHQSVLAATRAKSEFLAAMSHEIRTPMNAIVGMADLLMETALTPDQREFVERFSRASMSLMDLLNNILDISRIEAGHFELESIPFDLHDLVERAAELLATRASAKGIELMCYVHPDVPHHVLGDPTRLRQVLINLVGNAVKFTDRGEVTLQIEPARDQNDPCAIRFSVSDTGIGIPADKIQTIFENFSQVDSSTTRNYGGSGLGLSISQQIIGLMGSTIEVASTEGQGSTFSFVLLMTAVDAQEVSPSLPIETLEGQRILIVDDNDTNRMIIREHLARLGAVLVEVSDGLSALAALEGATQHGEPFDLAILDYHMPDMNGTVLAQAIRHRPDTAFLPLIMHTSQVRNDHTLHMRTLGVNSYLYKPISRNRLLQSVAAALGQPQHRLQAPASDGSAPAPLPPVRILLAEDLEDNRDVVTLFLKGTACRLDIAENGAVAVEKFRAGVYDLVLMDIQMPVMDGYNATASIRSWELERRRAPTPIVALTANAFQTEVAKSLSAGCTAHLTKPLKKKTLLDAIRKYVRPNLVEKSA